MGQGSGCQMKSGDQMDHTEKATHEQRFKGNEGVGEIHMESGRIPGRSNS